MDKLSIYQRQTYRQTCRHADKLQSHKDTDIETNKHTGIESNKHTNNETKGQRDTQRHNKLEHRHVTSVGKIVPKRWKTTILRKWLTKKVKKCNTNMFLYYMVFRQLPFLRIFSFLTPTASFFFGGGANSCGGGITRIYIFVGEGTPRPLSLPTPPL